MVQYVFTPWRDRRELLTVRRQFFPHPPLPGPAVQSQDGHLTPLSPEEERERQRAIARVFMWTHRGGCPHVVESTALLMAAIHQDRGRQGGAQQRHAQGGRAAVVADYAVLAAYVTAFTRFVTGLLDSHQEKQRKLSMYGVAKTIGLPAAFVELRHQSTHEPLPSLTQLRVAARRALDWIWDYYWKNLHEDDQDELLRHPQGGLGKDETACRTALMEYLIDEDNVKKDDELKGLRRWDEATVLRVLANIEESSEDSNLLLRSIKLSRKIVASREESTEEEEQAVSKDFERLKEELEQSRQTLQLLRQEDDKTTEETTELAAKDQGPAWSRYEGTWIPKPIGMV